MQSISLQVEIKFTISGFVSHAEKLHLPLLQITLGWTEMELQDTAHWTCGKDEISDISNFIDQTLLVTPNSNPTSQFFK